MLLSLVVLGGLFFYPNLSLSLSFSLSLSRVPLSCSMARTFSRTLIRVSSSCTSFSFKKLPPLVSSRIINHRNRSNKAEKGQLIEVDLDQESEVEVLGMRRLEDAIHGIIVKRSAPDWLPFAPGSSYWVPPRKSSPGLVELVGKLANPLTEEENLSLSTVRGWPSSSYFLNGESPHSFPVIENDEKPSNKPQSDDEEEKSKEDIPT